jgi:hypothetical protein
MADKAVIQRSTTTGVLMIKALKAELTEFDKMGPIIMKKKELREKEDKLKEIQNKQQKIEDDK